MGVDINGDRGYAGTVECLTDLLSYGISSLPVDMTISGSMFASSTREAHSNTAPCSLISASAPFLATRWQQQHPRLEPAPTISYDDVPVPPIVGATLPMNQRIHCSNVGLTDPQLSAAVMGFAAASAPDVINWIASSEDRPILSASNQSDVRPMPIESERLKRSISTADDFDPCHSPLSTSQIPHDSGQGDHLHMKETVNKDQKKPKSEHGRDGDARKQGRKQINQQEYCKEGKQEVFKDGKQDYAHVRAKRGQATNSHSLAERVRRERISERMRYLQNLVPGCDKITGKALMLDEIINYVQSLQRQVEFLSMKLATVNPELGLEINQILSKNDQHFIGENSSAVGFTLGLSASDMHPYGFMLQQAIDQPGTAFPYVPIPQGILRNTLSLISHSSQPSLLWEDEVRTDGTQMSIHGNIISRSSEFV